VVAAIDATARHFDDNVGAFELRHPATQRRTNPLGNAPSRGLWLATEDDDFVSIGAERMGRSVPIWPVPPGMMIFMF
jgi:hypothetical protein